MPSDPVPRQDPKETVAPMGLERRLAGLEHVTRFSPRDDRLCFRRMDRRQGGLIYIDVPAPPS